MDKQCSKCGSQMQKCELISYRDLTIMKIPSKLIGNKKSNINTYVCSNCGYLEFYAANPEKFK